MEFEEEGRLGIVFVDNGCQFFEYLSLFSIGLLACTPVEILKIDGLLKFEKRLKGCRYLRTAMSMAKMTSKAVSIIPRVDLLSGM